MHSPIEILVVLALMVRPLTPLNSCESIDKFDRNGCPSSDQEAQNEQDCLENNFCCWDTTWSGDVSKCFFSIGYTTTTELASSAAATENTINDMTQEELTTSFQDTTSQQSSVQVIAHIDGSIAKLLSGQPAELSKLLDESADVTSDQRADVIDKVLSASIANAESFSGNKSISQSLSSWLEFFDKILEIPEAKTLKNAQMFLNISSAILTNQLLRGNASSFDQSASSAVAINLEKYAIAMTTTLLANTPDGVSVTVSSQNNDFVFCKSSGSSDCDVTNAYVSASVTSNASKFFVNYISYKIKSDVFLTEGASPDARTSLGSSLFSVATHSDQELVSSAEVRMTFNITKDPLDDVACAFIDPSSGDWSDAGCTVTSQGASFASCSCNHNTSFAILFLHSDIKLTESEKRFFEIVTFIGCGTSITALLLTIFTFLYLKLTSVKRIILHMNLAVSLCLAQIVLLIGTNAPVGTAQCKVIAVLLHFFFMAAFSWMLMEGVLLYYQCVKAVSGNVNFNLVTVFGWLLPLVVVGVSVAAGFDGYGSDRGCWLSVNNGLIWAFVGPALGFIGINLLLLVMIIQVFLKLKTNAKSGEWKRAKRTIRAISVLTPLLGITWLFGVLAVDDSTKWFLYLFSIFNSLQGLTIFVFHCLRNEDVRKAFMKKYRKSLKNMGPFFTTITPSSSDTGRTFVKTNFSSMTSSPGLSHKARS